jgi:hypothetical protein
MTTPTTNPVPSAAAADLLFNAEKLDEAISSSASTYTDRKGVQRQTLAGALATLRALNIRGDWATATTYAVRDIARNAGTWYVALDTHTSGASFAGDQAAHWGIFQGITAPELAGTVATQGAGLVGYSDASVYSAGTLGAALKQHAADQADGTSATKGAGALGFGPSVEYAADTPGYELRAARAMRAGRTAPHANFTWFTDDFTVGACSGPGGASVAEDIADVFLKKYAAGIGSTTTYVMPTGSDSNGGTSWSQAFLTLNKALRLTTGGDTYVWPGEYDLCDFRYTDSYGDHPKRIIAPFGGVTLRVSGDNISAATWTAAASPNNDTWQTVLSTSNVPVRILMTDVVDDTGEPVPVPQYTTLADANASAFGWHYDSGTKTLSVRFKVENVNTTTKTRLKAIYGLSTGDNRTLLFSTVSYWENITFLGYVSVLNAAGQATPEFWGKRCTFKYGRTHSIIVEGGRSYTQDCRSHRTAADGANYNNLNSITARGVEINYRTEYSGDVGGYGAGQAANPQGTGQNKNGSSNHNGQVVRINGVHRDAYGPTIADTAVSGIPSYSWNVGVRVIRSALPPGSAPGTPRYGWLNQGNFAWLDGCASTGHDVPFYADSGSATKRFNSPGATSVLSGGTIQDYIP